MELVYLWVEEYKNIIGQGFNFSPRFECSYDEEKEELTINENKDYVSIFPENINVTAIVGENGSGKSSIIEVILDFTIRKDSLINGLVIRLYQIDKELILIKDDGSRIYQFKKSINQEKEISFLLSEEDLEKKGLEKNLFKAIYYKNILDENRVLTNDKTTIDLSSHEKLINGLSLYYSNNVKKIFTFLKNNKKKLTFKLPNKLYIEKSYFDLVELVSNVLRPTRYNKYRDKLLEIIKNNRTIKFDLYLIDHIYNSSLTDKFPDLEIERITDNSSFIEYLKKIDSTNKEQIKKIIQDLELFTAINDEQKVCEINDLPSDFIENYYSIDKYDQIFNFKFGDIKLSSGQYHFLLTFSELFYSINQFNENRNFALYFDETDLTLHPKWQKYYINELIKYLRITYSNDYNFFILLASHSPFILSDIPKENVIFLKNGKQEKPFKDDEQTFGANIHTLLSHGFFMDDDGLMGEFAKSKISELIKLLNSKRKLSKKNQKFCKNIISIIGEPILQKTLEHQLNEKLNPNETELQKLEREQKEIQEKIDKLKRENNETN